MLVVSRRAGQGILIGDDIEVIVAKVHRSSVKLAVRAPKHLTVLRSEVASDAAAGESPGWAVKDGCLTALKAGATFDLDDLERVLRQTPKSSP